jgi:4-aminobutyrate aminotransferase-like enzyme
VNAPPDGRNDVALKVLPPIIIDETELQRGLALLAEATVS